MVEWIVIGALALIVLQTVRIEMALNRICSYLVERTTDLPSSLAQIRSDLRAIKSDIYDLQRRAEERLPLKHELESKDSDSSDLIVPAPTGGNPPGRIIR